MTVVLIAYLVGTIPFALLLAGGWGMPDLRRAGSGNLGATNVFRVAGPTAGVLVAALDIAKGAAGVLIADRFSSGPALPAAAGMAAIVGHIYPIWLRFRGGKGVATACGVFSVLAPFAAGVALVVFVAGAWISGYVSAGSILASLVLPAVAYATGSPAPIVTAATAASCLIVFRHRSNLARMRAGTESRLEPHRSAESRRR